MNSELQGVEELRYSEVAARKVENFTGALCPEVDKLVSQLRSLPAPEVVGVMPEMLGRVSRGATGVSLQPPDEFVAYPKTPRLFRDVIISEKLDGTNASVFITEEGGIYAGSRNRWITPEDDNYGFARWVHDNREELLKLGPGRHFGEWWGAGIQRNYGLKEKRFSLFNVMRWSPVFMGQPGNECTNLPHCCAVVPVFWSGKFDTRDVENALEHLRQNGSWAVSGWMKPEGVIVYHVAAGRTFKALLEDDDKSKSEADAIARRAALGM